MSPREKITVSQFQNNWSRIKKVFKSIITNNICDVTLTYDLIITNLTCFLCSYLSSPVRKRSAACVSQISQSHQMSTGSLLTSWPSSYFTCCHSLSSPPRTPRWPADCGTTTPSVTQRQLSTLPRKGKGGGRWPCCSWWSGCLLSAGSHWTATWCYCPVRPSTLLTPCTSAFTGWLWAPPATTLSSTAVWIPPFARSWGCSSPCAGGNVGRWSGWSRSYAL